MPTARGPSWRLSTPVLLLALIASCQAQDDDYQRWDDVRLVIGGAPGIKKATITHASFNGTAVPSANGTTDYSAKTGPWVEADIMFRTPHRDGFGLVAGPGLFFTWARGEFTQGGIVDRRKLTAYGIMASFGPTFQADWLRIELLPFAGFGVGNGQEENIIGSSDVRDDSHHGWYLTYGGRVGVYADASEGFVGVQGGWQAYRSRISFPQYLGRATSVDNVAGSGLFGAIAAGVSF